ncbi:MAG: hypothetical protein ACE369_04360 [Roseovarius sp.]
MIETIEVRYQVSPDLMLASAYSSSLDPYAKQYNKPSPARHLGSIALWTVIFLVCLYALNLPKIDFPAGLITGLFLGFVAAVALNMVVCARRNGRLRKAAEAREILRGESVATFDKDGFSFSNQHERFEARWAAVDHIVALDQGTGIRIGIGTMPVPDSALPNEISPEIFRNQLGEWKGAASCPPSA